MLAIGVVAEEEVEEDITVVVEVAVRHHGLMALAAAMEEGEAAADRLMSQRFLSLRIRVRWLT